MRYAFGSAAFHHIVINTHLFPTSHLTYLTSWFLNWVLLHRKFEPVTVITLTATFAAG